MFKCRIEIPTERIADLLCCAFEGGSNYWIDDAKDLEEGLADYWDLDRDPEYTWEHVLACGRVKIGHGLEEHNLQYVTFDMGALLQGWKLFQEPKYRSHMADFINENEDAITGDVFLQLCVLGDVVYG